MIFCQFLATTVSIGSLTLEVASPRRIRRSLPERIARKAVVASSLDTDAISDAIAGRSAGGIGPRMCIFRG